MKNYSIVCFPGPATAFPTKSERLELAKKTAEHPVGKMLFPEGDVVTVFPQPHAGWLIPGDMPYHLTPRYMTSDHLTNGTALGELYVLWRTLSSQCHIGMYFVHDSDDPDEKGGSTTMGVHFDMSEDGYDDMIVVWENTSPEGASLGKARAAHLDSDAPFRAGGFYDDRSELRVAHRILPEDAGNFTYYFYVTHSVKSPESRKKAEDIYGITANFGFRPAEGEKNLDAAFVCGDMEFGYRRQQERPPEEGVPTAAEMDAVNEAFHMSLKSLVEEIAEKFAPGAAQGPVDFAAKIENDILLFAVVCEPTGNDVVVDWSRLGEIDLAASKLPNPYVESPKREFRWCIETSEAETWQDVAFSNVDCMVNGISMRIVVGQGDGILCGGIDFAAFRKLLDSEDDEARSIGEYMEMLKLLSPENQTRRSIAALKGGLEESQRIAEGGTLCHVPGVFALNTNDVAFAVREQTEKRGDAYTTKYEISVRNISPETVLALASQIFGNMFDGR